MPYANFTISPQQSIIRNVNFLKIPQLVYHKPYWGWEKVPYGTVQIEKIVCASGTGPERTLP